MSTNPLVTVLMTVYNGAEYLKTSINSIITQTFTDFELLIINDYSADNSVKIIESFNDKRIVIHNNERNLGQTKSLNIGLKLARGKYVARMDADDMAFSFWLEKLVKFFEKHQEYAAIGAQAIVIDSTGRTKKTRMVPGSFHEITFRIFFDSPMNHVSVLLNRELILKNGGYDEEFKVTQDYELWSSLIRNNYTITNISEVLVSYRVHSGSKGFMEASTRALEEMSETIFRNIYSFTNLKLTFDDAVGLCKLFYHTHDLNSEEFERAEGNFSNLYSNMREKYKLPPELAENGIKSIMSKSYCKLAIFEMQNSRIKTARKVALNYCRRYGFRVMPFLLYISTFLGYEISRKLPLVYERWLELKTKIFR
ncbi:MAG: glycosyltransferase family 2 protein [Candidatus Scalindua sp.]